MTNIKNDTAIKGSVELIKYCDHHKILSIGQLLETLIYFSNKYKTFHYEGKELVYDAPDKQAEKLELWYELIVNKEGFAALLDKYLKYKLKTQKI